MQLQSLDSLEKAALYKLRFYPAVTQTHAILKLYSCRAGSPEYFLVL